MSGGLFDTTERQQVYIALNLVTTVIGSAASVLTLLVIHRLKMTGHILLISTMTWFQLIYDVTFFFSNVNIGYWWVTVANVFQILGGVAGSLISNYIAYIAFHVVFYRKSYKVFDNYPMILTTSLVPAVANAIVLLIGSVPKDNSVYLINVSLVGIYYYIRLASIIVNFFICGATAYKIRRMSSNRAEKTYQEVAIRTLARRMIYYPILQAVSRSGYAWYEAAYGADIDQNEVSSTQYAALIFLTIITPTVSIGYLIIFLIMQPHAYNEFQAMLMCQQSVKLDANMLHSANSSANRGDDPNAGSGSNSMWQRGRSESNRSSASRYIDWGQRSSRASNVPRLWALTSFGPSDERDDREEEELIQAVDFGQASSSANTESRESHVQMRAFHGRSSSTIESPSEGSSQNENASLAATPQSKTEISQEDRNEESHSSSDKDVVNILHTTNDAENSV